VGALLGLVPLSVPVAKEPLYMAPVLPFFYALVALALVAPDRTPARYARVNRGAARASLVVALALAVPWLARALFGALPAAAIALPLVQIAIWMVPSLRVLRARSVAPTIVPCALGCLLLTGAVALASSLGFG
jgi:hypothetical protein